MTVPELFLLYLLRQSLLSYCCLPIDLGVFLLVLLLSVWCCCLLRPATHTPLLFRQDTNLQTLLALRSNLSGQGISCPMCSGERKAVLEMTHRSPVNISTCSTGVFMEKPHALHNHASSLAFKLNSVVAASSAQGGVSSDSNQTGKRFHNSLFLFASIPFPILT